MDLRDAVFEAVHEIVSHDRDAMILNNDMGAFRLDKIRAEYPGRVVNVGVAEQNLMSVSAGLALAGKSVFAYGIAAHITKRCYEQIQLDICTMNLPVTLLGIGSGLSYGGDGPTHHSNSDVAMLRAIPGMTIYNPSDGASARAAVRLAHENRSPAYIRMDKDQPEPIYADRAEFTDGLATLVKGEKVNVISSGMLVHRAISASKRLKQEGLSIGVVDMYRIKPCNYEKLDEILSGSEAVVALEEHSEIGGIGSIVAERIAELRLRPIFKRLSLGDEFYLGAATRPYVHEREGLSEPQILETLRALAREIG